MALTEKRDEYALLQDEDAFDSGSGFASLSPNKIPVLSIRGILTTLFAIVCISSLALNACLIYYISRINSHVETYQGTEFAGLKFDTPIPYEWHTPYNGDNQSLADELWAKLQPDIDAGLVDLTDEYTQSHQLLHAQRFPWDNKRGIYFLNGLHSMHCLKNIRRAFFEYRRGEQQSASFHHINHCMDTIRQDLMCFADDTPRNTGTTGPMECGVGQVRMCRSWDKLQVWAKRNTACFRYTDEDIEHSEITRYKFCPEEGERYMSAVREHFDLAEDWTPPPFDLKNYINVGVDGLKDGVKFAPDNVD